MSDSGFSKPSMRAEKTGFPAGLPSRIVGNIGLAAFFFAEAARIAMLATEIGLAEAGFIGVLVCAAIYVMRRGEASARDTSPGALSVSLIAAVWPFLFISILPETDHVSAVVYGVQLIAIGILLWSIVVLRTNFSVIPECRTVSNVGPYAAVRHPIYSAYLLFDAASVWEAYSKVALALWLFEAAVLIARGMFEERLLRNHKPDYSGYARAVRYRLIPFVF